MTDNKTRETVEYELRRRLKGSILRLITNPIAGQDLVQVVIDIATVLKEKEEK